MKNKILAICIVGMFLLISFATFPGVSISTAEIEKTLAPLDDSITIDPKDPNRFGWYDTASKSRSTPCSESKNSQQPADLRSFLQRSSLMVIGGFGTVGTYSSTESEDDCRYCDSGDNYEDGSDSLGLSDADIAALQVQGESEGWTFTVGENSATQFSLNDLYGLVEPEGWQDNAHFDPCNTLGSDNLPEFFDWRRQDPTDSASSLISGFPSVKNQGACGSCWAFGTVGPLECNIRIKDGKTVDLSEQYLLSCNTDGYGCDGGWWAHDYHQWKEGKLKDGVGAVMENDFRYVGYKASCKSCTHEYLIKDWAFIGSQYSTPAVNNIKQAIMDHGPVSVAVRANTAMQTYSGGIFNACESGKINHAVALIGWDDDQGDDGVWFMRNSWGTGWGENGGYMRIPYGCSSIGYSACYVEYEPQDMGDRRVDVEISKITNEPKDEFDQIDHDIPFTEIVFPEWYYRVGVESDGKTKYKHNQNKKPGAEGDFWYDWKSEHTWDAEQTHLFYADSHAMEVTVTIKLMDHDNLITEGGVDDLADVSAVSGGGTDNSVDDKRAAIYHGTYNLETNQLTTSDPVTGPDSEGYYTTKGDGKNNAKVWFRIYDPIVADAGGPYTGIENVDIQFEGAAVQYSGRSPYSFHWDFGDDSTSNQQNPTHAYATGDYTATLTVTDNDGDSDVAYAEVTVYENTAPSKPSRPSGPANGGAGREYEYTAVTTDPDGVNGDKIYYWFDWGDGSDSGWVGPYESGETADASHSWTERGDYEIKVKAKDLNGLESPWSPPLSISMPKNKESTDSNDNSNSLEGFKGDSTFSTASSTSSSTRSILLGLSR